ncbi:hypothetical protein CLV35_0837 [Motilibacter peucedani]|uniref:FtsX-like permease family protein n=1 Tax=Motilibacter peucedani TaxID=598650 RepID=A0A420XU94_9ACTN|nr:permease [Motilibacter peucedani]RKS80406.1 hypothetical protein CLV35_0837 [Motilibacter peucedani]
MLGLLLLRARVQLALLAAVLAVVTAGATLLGVSALLLTRTQERALDVAVVRAQPKELDVTAIATGVRGGDVTSVASGAGGVVRWVLEPLGSTSTRRFSSAMRRLGDGGSGSRQLGYLSALDALTERADLLTGRWPAAGGSGGALEAVVPEATARALHLSTGTRVALGAETGGGNSVSPVDVRVVGTFRPRPAAGWERDPLGGAGVEIAYQDGYSTEPAQAYGPFVVALPDLMTSGSTVDRLDVTASPVLTGVTGARLAEVSARLSAADPRLSAALRQRPAAERISSELPRTLAVARTQQSATRTVVLVVVLLGIALTATALGLAGRLVTALRAGETELLAALGAGPRQLLATAALEAAVLAALASVVAVPLSTLAHTGLTHLPVLERAGLAAGPSSDGAQLQAVVLGAVALAAVLVLPALRRDRGEHSSTRPSRRGLAARSGADLLLVGLALVGVWQLRDQPAASTARTDVVRVVSPALCLLAGAVVALRVVPLPLRGVDALARRSRALVLPLAAFEAARRPRAVAAALLLALTAAVTTFGASFGSTWQRSQHDQADIRVGTDASVSLVAPPEPGEGARVAAATGGTVSPVTDRPVAVGWFVGEQGLAPRLLAVDTAHAGALLRGRRDGRWRGTTWAASASRLRPTSRIVGVPLPSTGVTISGTASAGAELRATPRLLTQDATGLRTLTYAAPVRLDGSPHPLVLNVPLPPGLQLVGVALRFETVDQDAGPAPPSTDVSVTVHLPGATGGSTGWSAAPTGSDRSTGSEQVVTAAGVQVTSAGGATDVRTRAAVSVPGLVYGRAEVLSTALDRPQVVPVAASHRLLQTIHSSVGDELAVTVGATTVRVRVAAEVPYVPSLSGGIALLADADLLSRALVGAGQLDPAVDGWWVGDPQRADAAARLRALDIGDVLSRRELDDELARGPLRVVLPAALGVLLVAAVLLALVGTTLHVTADLESRALEVARLRGLGLPRRAILTALLVQHGAVLALLLSTGTVVGAVTSAAFATRLVRSDLGAEPTPAVLEQWPWGTEVALVGGVLLGCLALTALVVSVQVRRADTAHLRVAS